jgi:hypothetical protein
MSNGYASPKHLTPSGQTISSFLKQKPPLPYTNLMRKVTGRLKYLQDELSVESATNVEFEESSRRSFVFIAGQIKALKNAFQTLTDTLLEELDQFNHSVKTELGTMDQRIDKSLQVIRDVQQAVEINLEDVKLADLKGREQLRTELGEHQQIVARITDQSSMHEKKMEQLQQDLDTVLNVIPKIEDTMLRSDSMLQDKIASATLDISKINDFVAMERVRTGTSIDRIDAKMKEIGEDIEARYQRIQRSMTKQIEQMSRVLIQGLETPQDPPVPYSPAAPRSRSSPRSHGHGGHSVIDTRSVLDSKTSTRFEALRANGRELATGLYNSGAIRRSDPLDLSGISSACGSARAQAGQADPEFLYSSSLPPRGVSPRPQSPQRSSELAAGAMS